MTNCVDYFCDFSFVGKCKPFRNNSNNVLNECGMVNFFSHVNGSLVLQAIFQLSAMILSIPTICYCAILTGSMPMPS